MDVVTPEVRSRMMARIRGKDTAPELIIRRALFSRGFRFRLHDKRLPGRPDLFLRKFNTAIFVQGCFWHMHNCHLFAWPKTRKDWWKEKLNRNRLRDEKNTHALLAQGVRVAVIWECALKASSVDNVVDSLAEFLRCDDVFREWRA